MRLIRELSEHQLRSGSCFVSIQLLRNGQCHPNATSGVLPSPIGKYPPTIHRKFNAGGRIRTHTGVPPQRVLSPQFLPFRHAGTIRI